MSGKSFCQHPVAVLQTAQLRGLLTGRHQEVLTALVQYCLMIFKECKKILLYLHNQQ